MDVMSAYAMKRSVDLSVDEADAKVREELAKEGFGVLTEIDVEAVLDQKLGVSFPPYRILGACNPSLAHQALGTETDIGLLLPCNVLVYQGESEGSTYVAAIDPVAQLGVAGRDDLAPIAEEVKERLQRVIEAV